MVLDLSGQSFQVLLISAETLKSILAPEITEVGLDLIDESLWQGLVIRKPGEQCQPVVEVATLVDCTHFLFVVSNDFNEVTHDE